MGYPRHIRRPILTIARLKAIPPKKKDYKKDKTDQCRPEKRAVKDVTHSIFSQLGPKQLK